MTTLKPNKHGDWVNKRNDKFSQFIPLEPESKFDSKSNSFFMTYAIGVATNRDAWVYNYSVGAIAKNMRNMIAFYNKQAENIEKKTYIENMLDNNPTKISWTVNLKKDAERNILHKFDIKCIIHSLYRPYCKQSLYFDTNFIERPGIHSKLFPTEETENLLICISGIGSTKDFSSLITNEIPCLDLVDKSQCFPLYWYEKKDKVQGGLFEQIEDEYIRHDGISDFIFEQAKSRYGNRATKEDIFYYVYGILHSREYRKNPAQHLQRPLYA
jgi:predicted helicase